jgi:hypothetical protein
LEFEQGGKTGREAADVTSIRRGEERPGANRSIVGVQNDFCGVLSRAHDAKNLVCRAAGKTTPPMLWPM